MREESHLDEMRSAIRGDFERLAKKRGRQELMHMDELESESEGEADEADEPAEERVDEPADELVDEPADEQPPRRSWLDRLLRG